jgi:hypothetical protein
MLGLLEAELGLNNDAFYLIGAAAVYEAQNHE